MKQIIKKAIKERDTALAQYTETLKKAEDAEKDLKTAKDNLAKTQETMTDLLSRELIQVRHIVICW